MESAYIMTDPGSFSGTVMHPVIDRIDDRIMHSNYTSEYQIFNDSNDFIFNYDTDGTEA